MVAVEVGSSVYWGGGESYVRIRGLHWTSFYIPLQLLRQLNMPQTISPALRYLSAESVEADDWLTLRLVAMCKVGSLIHMVEWGPGLLTHWRLT